MIVKILTVLTIHDSVHSFPLLMTNAKNRKLFTCIRLHYLLHTPGNLAQKTESYLRAPDSNNSFPIRLLPTQPVIYLRHRGRPASPGSTDHQPAAQQRQSERRSGASQARQGSLRRLACCQQRCPEVGWSCVGLLTTTARCDAGKGKGE